MYERRIAVTLHLRPLRAIPQDITFALIMQTTAMMPKFLRLILMATCLVCICVADPGFAQPSQDMRDIQREQSDLRRELKSLEHGGLSKGISAKDGKLGFVDAEEPIFLWAKQMGYTGEKLTQPTMAHGRLEAFSYLEVDVVHFKVNGARHIAVHEVSELTLPNFLRRGENAVQK